MTVLSRNSLRFSSAFFRGQLSDSHLSNIHLHRRLDESCLPGIVRMPWSQKQRRRRYAQNVHANCR